MRYQSVSVLALPTAHQKLLGKVLICFFLISYHQNLVVSALEIALKNGWTKIARHLAVPPSGKHLRLRHWHYGKIALWCQSLFICPPYF